MRACMDYHTWVADRTRVRNFLDAGVLRTVAAAPKAADANAAPSIAKTNDTIDGDAVFEWHQSAATNSLLLGELDLLANPSAVNRSVFLALDTRLLLNATLELLMDAGDGVWRTSGTGIEKMHISNVPETNAVYQCGDAQRGSRLWAVSSFQLQLGAVGTARFGLRVSAVQGSTAGGPVLQLRKVGAAVVGVGGDRMFAEPTPAAGPSCERDAESSATAAMEADVEQLKAELAQVGDLKAELELLKRELRGAARAR